LLYIEKLSSVMHSAFFCDTVCDILICRRTSKRLVALQGAVATTKTLYDDVAGDAKKDASGTVIALPPTGRLQEAFSVLRQTIV